MGADKILQASKEKTQVLRKQEIEWVRFPNSCSGEPYAFQMLKEDDFPLTAKLLIKWVGEMRTFSDKSVLKKNFISHTPYPRKLLEHVFQSNRKAETRDETQQRGEGSPTPTLGMVTVL